MKLNERDRRAVRVGGVLALVVAVVIYIVLPIGRHWVRMGDELEPKLDYVDRLRERVDDQRAMLARRARLVRQMGALALSAGDSEAGAGDDKGADEKSGVKEESPEPKPGSKPDEADDSSSAPEGKSPDDAGPAKTPEGGHEGPPPEKRDVPPGEEPSPEANKDGAHPPGPPAVGAGVGKPPEESPEAVDDPAEAKADGPPEPGEAPEKPSGPDKKEAEQGQDTCLATLLEQTAKKSGVKLNRLSPKKASGSSKARKYYKPVVLQVAFECDIAALLKMLHALEKGERFVRVNHIQINRDLKTEKLTGTLDAFAYEPATRTS